MNYNKDVNHLDYKVLRLSRHLRVLVRSVRSDKFREEIAKKLLRQYNLNGKFRYIPKKSGFDIGIPKEWEDQWIIPLKTKSVRDAEQLVLIISKQQKFYENETSS